MSQQRGFTIIELLLATTVFSLILLICAYAVLQIGRSYYKGITASQTQDNARSIIDQISQGIQFSGSTIVPTGSQNVFCIGDQRYTYKLNQQVEDTPNGPHQGHHALVVDTFPNCGPGTPQDISGNVSGRELVAANMRLAKLVITPVPGQQNLYNVDIRLVYGDDDLLCSPSVANDCSSNAVSSLNNNPPDITCKNFRFGTQFCAVSELNTNIQKRVQ